MSLSDPFLMRNLVYGIEDSLVSTSGVIIGIALAGVKRREILITGSILVMVEALSMAFGSFVSEDSFMLTAKMAHAPMDVLKYALVMFLSYVLAGLVPMLPFILDFDHAWRYSFALAILALFSLLYWFDRKIKKASILATVGGVILGISVMTGSYLKH